MSWPTDDTVAEALVDLPNEIDLDSASNQAHIS